MHHSTTSDVTRTLLTYEKDAKTFLRQWGRKKYKRPALLKEWMALLPKQGVLLDLGCGAGQDARYLATLGHRVI
ncbi:MAG: SAM-dependent methyltransferase, partial [Nitrospira sp.]|nr:SAM-dependent methyltransferase [Nitrospira sp.]